MSISFKRVTNIFLTGVLACALIGCGGSDKDSKTGGSKVQVGEYINEKTKDSNGKIAFPTEVDEVQGQQLIITIDDEELADKKIYFDDVFGFVVDEDDTFDITKYTADDVKCDVSLHGVDYAIEESYTWEAAGASLVQQDGKWRLQKSDNSDRYYATFSYNEYEKAFEDEMSEQVISIDYDADDLKEAKEIYQYIMSTFHVYLTEEDADGNYVYLNAKDVDGKDVDLSEYTFINDIVADFLVTQGLYIQSAKVIEQIYRDEFELRYENEETGDPIKYSLELSSDNFEEIEGAEFKLNGMTVKQTDDKYFYFEGSKEIEDIFKVRSNTYNAKDGDAKAHQEVFIKTFSK